jgi:hypothetical protein
MHLTRPVGFKKTPLPKAAERNLGKAALRATLPSTENRREVSQFPQFPRIPAFCAAFFLSAFQFSAFQHFSISALPQSPFFPATLFSRTPNRSSAPHAQQPRKANSQQ